MPDPAAVPPDEPNAPLSAASAGEPDSANAHANVQTTPDSESFTFSGLVQHMRENVRAATDQAKRVASAAKDALDLRAARKKREQLVVAILARWVYANRETLCQDPETRDLFLQLDVYDRQLAALEAEDLDAEPDGEPPDAPPAP